MDIIICRKKEKEILQELFDSKEPQFLAVYGRRRVGKTFLVSEFFHDKGLYFEMTGMKKASKQEQLLNFTYELSRRFTNGEAIAPPKSWVEAFHLLNDEVEKIQGQKVILFFDEIPWLASRKSGFLSALEHFWNRYLSRLPNVILIVCGSAASWVIKNIINNTGGLYGRLTRTLCLTPFNLAETEEYLIAHGIDLGRKQVIDLYMALGGVPKYLNYVRRGLSAAQNIEAICFAEKAPLHNEFEKLYKSIFDSYEGHVSIVRTLAKHPSGLVKNDLLQETSLSSGGTSSKIIDELVASGFILYIPAFEKNRSGGTYRLTDEYSLFYLNWISPSSKIGPTWTAIQNTPRLNAWRGHAFEALCLKHVQEIKTALGISGIATHESAWCFIPKKGSDELGAQIDLVIDRSDGCINLCEIKFVDSDFVIEKSLAAQLENKKRQFRAKTGTRKALFTTLISSYGLKKNAHYLACVDKELTMDVLFC